MSAQGTDCTAVGAFFSAGVSFTGLLIRIQESLDEEEEKIWGLVKSIRPPLCQW